MKQGHIQIFGDIINFQAEDISQMGGVSLKDVAQQIKDNAGADELIVHIHSPGGEVMEGFAIHDALVGSGKKITTSIEGQCASIATVIALAGTTRHITKNSEFMIHNPWGFAGGDAEELQKYTDQVKAYEEKILNFYVDKTGADKDTIKSMMDKETQMTPEEALELKFVTDVVEQVKAFAKISPIKNTDKTMFEELKKQIADLKKDIKASLNIKSQLNLSTSDGKKLEIDTDKTEPEVGNVVNIDGKAAPDGDYKMPDGRTIVVASGKISEVKAAEEPANKDLDEVKAALKEATDLAADLKKKLETAEAANATAKTEAEGIQAKFEEIKNLTSQYIPKERQQVFNRQSNEAPVKTAEDYKKEADERKAQYKNKK